MVAYPGSCQNTGNNFFRNDLDNSSVLVEEKTTQLMPQNLQGLSTAQCGKGSCLQGQHQD